MNNRRVLIFFMLVCAAALGVLAGWRLRGDRAVTGEPVTVTLDTGTPTVAEIPTGEWEQIGRRAVVAYQFAQLVAEGPAEGRSERLGAAVSLMESRAADLFGRAIRESANPAATVRVGEGVSFVRDDPSTVLVPGVRKDAEGERPVTVRVRLVSNPRGGEVEGAPPYVVTSFSVEADGEKKRSGT